MAGETKKISEMKELAVADVTAVDEGEIVDKSDTTDASTGTNKKWFPKLLVEYLIQASTYITGLFGNYTFDGDALKNNDNAVLTNYAGYSILNNPTVIGSDSDAPSTPIEGMIYYNSTSKTLKYYNGTDWVDIKFDNFRFTSFVSGTRQTMQALNVDTLKEIMQYVNSTEILRIGGGTLGVTMPTLSVDDGASGSFTAQSGETVTVANGIITSIV